MTPRKSKTWATWLALFGGGLGLHRFYLLGLRDWGGWLYSLPTLLGLLGVHRAWTMGQDDRLAWGLIPLLGISLSAAMLTAIIYGLTPDERWDQAHNAGRASRPSGWGAVIGVIFALLVGATVLLSTLSFSLQRWFESQAA